MRANINSEVNKTSDLPVNKNGHTKKINPNNYKANKGKNIADAPPASEANEGELANVQENDHSVKDSNPPAEDVAEYYGD